MIENIYVSEENEMLLVPKNPKVEVKGPSILSFIDAVFFKEKAKAMLKTCDLDNVSPDNWYPQQKYLNLMQKIVDILGEATLMTVGTKIVNNVPLPKMDNITECFNFLNEAYHMNHRHDDETFWKVTENEKRYMVVETNNPYPCVFDVGLLRGFATSFEKSAVVKEIGTSCRNNGGDTCQYRISW